MADADGTAVRDKGAQESRPKRVRTGCLTCRERHLKCDEATPDCHNCTKSDRRCKRGVRLNFIDIKVDHGYLIPLGEFPVIAFEDESRAIASEYKNGRERYNALDKDQASMPTDGLYLGEMQRTMAPPTQTSLPALAPVQGLHQDTQMHEANSYNYDPPQAASHHHTHSHTNSVYSEQHLSHATPSYAEPSEPESPQEGARDYLDTQEEVLFMQVFVEEVGLWMDSMDPMKHFSRLLPFHALSEPMLLNAFLACGARHLALVNPKYSEDKALHYYDTATRHLLQQLQNPDRDTVICATTAVILNVYEIMCEKALQRMNHIAGARALIKECGWNAQARGIGAACFWLNVGMELLSCLHFNWQVAWDPDEWGVDMNMSRETESGKEELWTYRIVYIVAKVANFRASIPRTAESAQHSSQSRYTEWKNLKDWADRWNENIPRTMHPMAYLYPGSTLSGSAFPEVWLIKRTSIVARLFYHTCMCLLAQINPLQSPQDPEMLTLLQRHSQLICGISAHVKDRGVASVALRSLAIAAECLQTKREQEEVLQIFDKIRQETGWRVGFLHNELKEKWGWNNQPQEQAQSQQQNIISHSQNGNMQYQQQQVQQQVAMQQQQQVLAPISLPPAPPVQQRSRPPAGIPNPLMAQADFSLTQHPYQSYYVAPNPTHQATNQLGNQLSNQLSSNQQFY